MSQDSDLRDRILSEIRRLSTGDKAIGRDVFFKETGLKEYHVTKFWAHWSDAVAAAGFSPNKFGAEKLSRDTLLKLLADLTRELGRFPTGNHLRWAASNKQNWPSNATFSKTLGRKTEIVQSLLDWISQHPEYSDLVELLNKEHVFDNLEVAATTVPEKDRTMTLTNSYIPPVIACLPQLARLI